MLLHGGPRVHGNNGFRGWGTVFQGAARPASIVVMPPFLDQDLGFAQGVEDVAFEEFTPKPGVEALAKLIFPRGAGLDESGLCPCGGDLGSHPLGAIVGPCESGRAEQN